MTDTSIKPAMRFDLNDKVRVVSAASPFFGWVGEVIASYNGDLMLGRKHYQVLFHDPQMMLLFTETELAYAEYGNRR